MKETKLETKVELNFFLGSDGYTDGAEEVELSLEKINKSPVRKLNHFFLAAKKQIS